LVSNPHFSQTRRWPSFSNLDINSEQLTEKHLLPYAYTLSVRTARRELLIIGTKITMNKLGVVLGVLLFAVAAAAAPMPLNVSIPNPTRVVTIYPNLLFAVPLLLLATLLLLYGAVTNHDK